MRALGLRTWATVGVDPLLDPRTHSDPLAFSKVGPAQVAESIATCRSWTHRPTVSENNTHFAREKNTHLPIPHGVFRPTDYEYKLRKWWVRGSRGPILWLFSKLPDPPLVGPRVGPLVGPVIKALRRPAPEATTVAASRNGQFGGQQSRPARHYSERRVATFFKAAVHTELIGLQS